MQSKVRRSLNSAELDCLRGVGKQTIATKKVKNKQNHLSLMSAPSIFGASFFDLFHFHFGMQCSWEIGHISQSSVARY